MSIHEEAFNSAQNPMMAVFNNLVLFKQDVPQNRMDTNRTRSGDQMVVERRYDRAYLSSSGNDVSWHDGKPFTAATLNALGPDPGHGADKLRTNRASLGTATWIRSAPKTTW